MIRSMTGFGTAEGRVWQLPVIVEVRSVNHRFFNPSIKLPGAFARWEGEVREALRQRISRGHVTVFARIEREAQPGGGVINEARFAGYVEQLRELQRRYGLGGEGDVSTVLRMPEVFASQEAEETGTAAELVALVDQAAQALSAMRLAEGARLAAYLRERLEIVEAALRRIAERAPQRVVEQRDRLRQAVQELAQGVAVDEQRLAQEIAFLADRLDVEEELSRFRAHIAAF